MTQVRSSSCPAILLVAFLTLIAWVAAGCGSPSRPKRSGTESQKVERPIAMKGESGFFADEITATVTVSRGFDRKFGSSRRARREGVYGETPSLTEVFSNELSDPDNKDYQDTIEKMRALQLRGSPLPPVKLQMHLHNRGAQPVEIEILELNSDLGNFAVRPSKLTIPAASSAEIEPMNSQLGVTSNEIPVKVRLRRDGKTEIQMVLVKSLFTAEGKKVEAETK